MVITTIWPRLASILPSNALPLPVSYDSPCINTITGNLLFEFAFAILERDLEKEVNFHLKKKDEQISELKSIRELESRQVCLDTIV